VTGAVRSGSRHHWLMVRLFVFLAAVQLVLLVLALISALSADRVRTMPRALWVLVILLIPLLGPGAYFLFGRPLPAPREGGPVRRTAPRPASPDDDPEFLRSMNIEQSRRDRELLDELERELHNRDDE
jgi:Phospholipase_D-nuclease N-terminal